MARRGRITATGHRAEALGAMVDGWLADLDTGRNTVMLAWRHTNVDALNQLARQACTERGWLTGPELTAPGGRRYRAGDRVVTLTPSAGVVTSQTGTVEAVDIDRHLLWVRLDAGWTTTLSRGFTSSNQLAHAYALTVHRSQGATMDTAHYLEDGGGRELAYVALSRARHHSTVYTQADDLPKPPKTSPSVGVSNAARPGSSTNATSPHRNPQRQTTGSESTSGEPIAANQEPVEQTGP